MRLAKFWHVLERKKTQLFFLFYVLLILPLLTPLAQNIPWREAVNILCINTVLFLALSLFTFFLKPKVEKILYMVLLIFAMIPGAMFLGYLIFARVLLEQNSITSLFETNPEESREFMLHYFNVWVIVGVVTYVVIPIVMIWRMKSYKPLTVRRYKILFSVSLTLILCIVFISRLGQSVYFINFYNTFASYKIRLYNENKAIARRQAIMYEVTHNDYVKEPQTVVVVIGESLTRNHMQLYGYGRATNPLLSAKKDSIYVFTDVISPQVHTIPVIRSVLTFSERGDYDYFTTKPSVFELFNRAGYDTYFISNQPFEGNFKTSYHVLLELAQHTCDLTPQKKHDEVVLDKLQEILDTPTDRNRFVIVHLIGNHMAYKFRYPPKFAVFDHTKDNFVKPSDYQNKEAVQTIDEYDNSVAYNDFVIAGIIDMLNKNKSHHSAMIYFSDHGEELYDYRNFAGHAYEKASAYMCEVPFILWTSSGFIKNRPDLRIDTSRPYSTADFVYSLSNLAGLEYIDYNSRRSVFSGDFIPDRRFVGDIPYEDLLKRKK